MSTKGISGNNSPVYGKAVLIGMCTGAVLCMAGVVFVVLGLAGSIEWIIKAGGLESRLSNASPGAFFAVVGLVVMWKMKPKIRVKSTFQKSETDEAGKKREISMEFESDSAMAGDSHIDLPPL